MSTFCNDTSVCARHDRSHGHNHVQLLRDSKFSCELELMTSSGKVFSIDEVVRGYHICKDIWDADIGSELPCYPESSNREDRYAVAVMNDAI